MTARPPLPPVLRGLPLLGVAPEFRRDPVATLWRGYRALGPVFAVRLGWMRAAVLIGPEPGRVFFGGPDEVLSLPEVYRFLVPMFGRTLQAADGTEYARHRTVMQPSFSSARMGGYLEVMVRETRAWLDTLGDEGTLDLRPALEALSLRIAAEALMGSEFRAAADGRFGALYADVAGGLEFILPTNLPLPRFRRRDRARAALHAMLRPIVAARRARPGAYADFLAAFACARFPDGSPVPEETAVDLALLLVFAAYETTSAQSAWALLGLLLHPAWLARVVEEQEEVLADEADAADPAALKKLERLGWAIREAERLTPATTLLMRQVARELEVGGFRIPAGWKAVVCPAVTHRLPELYSRPHEYDPERFSPERGEGSAPGSLLNFGGGLHRCLGLHFARYEMKVILALLLRRYALELVDRDPRPDYRTGLTRPLAPCRVRYRRHRREAARGENPNGATAHER